MWQSETLIDVTVQVEGVAFKAHKFVLAGGSAYFRGILTSGMCDGGDKLDLSAISASCFKHVANWLYSGACTLSDESMLPELLEAASFLQVPELVQKTAAELAQRITLSNVSMAWDLGESFYVPSLVEAARRVARAEFESFAESEAFLMFGADRLGQLIADDQVNAPETVVFESVVRFLTQSPTGPLDDATAMMLFGHVRFALLPLEFVQQRVEQEPQLTNRPWGGWVVARAFRDVLYSRNTPLASHRHVRKPPLQWNDLRVGMKVYMLKDKSTVLKKFELKEMPPGATKPIAIGSLHQYLERLLGKEHVVEHLVDDKRGIRIKDGHAVWLLPYTVFVSDADQT